MGQLTPVTPVSAHWQPRHRCPATVGTCEQTTAVGTVLCRENGRRVKQLAFRKIMNRLLNVEGTAFYGVSDGFARRRSRRRTPSLCCRCVFAFLGSRPRHCRPVPRRPNRLVIHDGLVSYTSPRDTARPSRAPPPRLLGVARFLKFMISKSRVLGKRYCLYHMSNGGDISRQSLSFRLRQFNRINRWRQSRHHRAHHARDVRLWCRLHRLRFPTL